MNNLPITSLKAVAERLVLTFFFGYLLAVILACLLPAEWICAELLLFGGPSALPAEFCVLILFGISNLPLLIWLRQVGFRHLHFGEHLAALDGSFQIDFPIYELIEAIEEAGVWERQEARQRAKAWVEANWEALDEEAREYVREQIGYLLKNRE